MLAINFFLRANVRESPKCGKLYDISEGSTNRVGSRFYREHPLSLTHSIQYTARVRCNDSHFEFMIYFIYGFSDKEKDKI